ncbi:hypothetical protein STEG23_008962 [Scotinomys teguina]
MRGGVMWGIVRKEASQDGKRPKSQYSGCQVTNAPLAFERQDPEKGSHGKQQKKDGCRRTPTCLKCSTWTTARITAVYLNCCQGPVQTVDKQDTGELIVPLGQDKFSDCMPAPSCAAVLDYWRALDECFTSHRVIFSRDSPSEAEMKLNATQSFTLLSSSVTIHPELFLSSLLKLCIIQWAKKSKTWDSRTSPHCCFTEYQGVIYPDMCLVAEKVISLFQMENTISS